MYSNDHIACVRGSYFFHVRCFVSFFGEAVVPRVISALTCTSDVGVSQAHTVCDHFIFIMAAGSGSLSGIL